MTKTQTFTAKTVEDAKALAARTFGVAVSEIEFKVLEEPKRGLFGIMRGDAKVQASYHSIDEPIHEYKSVSVQAEETPAAIPVPVVEVTPEPEETVAEAAQVIEEAVEEVEEAIEEAVEEIITEEVQEAAPVVEKLEEETPAAESIAEVQDAVSEAVAAYTNAPAEEVSAPEEKVSAPVETPAEEAPVSRVQEDEELITGEPSENSLAKIEKAKVYLSSILEKMGVQAELKVTAGAESAMIEIVSANSGAVIGKRGETLDALQYLTFMIANRGDKEYYRIILNSANYRERRRKTLEELAAKIARNVLRSGRQTTLEPMNPYERRIIHSAIAEIEGVSSKSIGEEPYRKVVISSLNKPPRRSRNNRDNNGERRGRNDRNGDRRRNHNNSHGRDRRRSDAPPERISMDSMKTSFEKDYKRPKAEDEINAGLYGKIEF